MASSKVNVDHDMHWDWPLEPDHFIDVKNTDNEFAVDLEAKYFQPKEIEVKTVGDLLEVHLEHQSRGNKEGMVSRNITRCYRLPNDLDTASLRSNLDKDGILHIRANKRH